jgi:hypothetical protein
MKRIIITGAVLLAVVPTSLGLIANASFAQSAPSVVPTHSTVLDDRGGLTAHLEPGDDRGGLTAHAEPGDDRGGLTAHAEPGDDRGGRHGGSDDGPGHS